MTRRVVHSLLCLFLFLLVSAHAIDNVVSEALSGLDGLVTGDTYSCNKTNPCSNGACCAKSGYCGFGDKYCGTTDESPNDACWSNCDAHAECGKDAVPAHKGCPLNVCCSPYGFCGTTSEFCDKGKGCQSGCDQPSSNATGSNVQQRIIGYYEAWQSQKSCIGMNVDQVPVEDLTHINYAFAVIEPDTYKVGPMPKADESTLSDFTALKERNPNVVVGVSIGGWDFNNNHTDTQGVFADIVSSSDKRQKFVDELMKFMKHYAFDAVDLDWEYPGAPDRQPPKTNTTGNTEGYVKLVQDIRKAFDAEDKKYELSFTTPTSYWYLRWFDIKEMSKAADYVNVMSYDLHGVWDADDPIGSHVLAHTNLTEIKQAMDLLWRNEVPAQKVNFGLAFYSRTFQLEDKDCWHPGCDFKGGGMEGPCTKNSGTLSYRELTDIMVSKDVNATYDEEAAVKYFKWNEDQWASYDDQQTFQQKIEYANDQGLGGLLIWSLDQDTSNLDDLRGVIYPADLRMSDHSANDVSYWESKTVGDCQTSPCGGSCSAGLIEIETIECGLGDLPQKICCPIASAPDPSTCHWRGGETGQFCNGQCHGGEVAISSSVNGGNGYCVDGRQFYCCPIPEVADGGGINCGWQDSCRSDQEPLTFHGTVASDFVDIAKFGGLIGEALSDALQDIDVANRQLYCCGKEEIKNWKDCYWAGTTGKGPYSCDDGHCATGHEVELTDSPYGGGKTCSPMDTSRSRAFCCTPASGESLFMPVPLDYLFPDPPPDDGNPKFNLKVDDTWGTGKSKSKEDPNAASFGFVVITAPDEVSVSLDKRDGSPWEVMDCVNTDSEEEQTVRLICTDDSETSLCHKIHLGHGVPGTILQMPDSCGPGRYAVAKSFSVSDNQELPENLAKRDLGSSQVYDLTYDYNFRRVPRSYGDSKMRLDFSNEKGYWDSVVDRPGDTKRKRDHTYHENPKRWMEEEWREAYHFGGLDRDELHKRWFGEGAIAWLANLIGVSEAEHTEEFTHSVKEKLEVILIDQQFGPCPVGPAQAQANLRATVDANLQVDTSFGVTIIATFGDGEIDLSDSYLFFKNKGEVTAKFQLDAVASLTYNSGDVKLFGLDDFPGATFRVPGVVTIGPNLAVYAAADAQFTVAGHVEAEVTVAKWDIRQTYPETDKYEPDAIDEPDYDGTQTLGDPKFEASITARGEIVLHLKPTVQFGIDFDKRWGVDKATVDLVLDAYTIAHAQASASTNSDDSCPFSYGIDAGSDIYCQLNAPDLFGWGGQSRYPIASVPRKAITPESCAGSGNKRRSLDEIDPRSGDYVSPFGSVSAGGNGLNKRDAFSLGPLITVPDTFLKCPSNNSNTNGIDCPVCSFKDNDDDTISKRDGDVCFYPGPSNGGRCTDSSLAKRANGDKYISLSWMNDDIKFSRYPQCSAGNLKSLNGIAQWYMPKGAGNTPGQCGPEVAQFPIDNTGNSVNGVPIGGKFENDHVFEAQLVSKFLEWLCNGKPLIYVGGPIPFPKGFSQPNTEWCSDVFGEPDSHESIDLAGWKFPSSATDNSPNNWIMNAAAELGGTDRRDLMALFYAGANNAKGSIVQGANVATGDRHSAQLRMQGVVNGFAAFSYLKDPTIKPKWTAPSQGIERVCKFFDDNYWGKAPERTYGSTRTRKALGRPQKVNGVTNWGMRTLWCYWIDTHLARVEQQYSNWAITAKTNLQNVNQIPQVQQTEITAANNFITQFMNNGGGASPSDATFPKNLAAVQGQASVYEMWGGNGYGALGL
ncbi:glycosyl hydrolases family 18-domain-containing protein [Penicillium canescens]|uniref:chitinase n=1 Tax=Penicillium canescens TaxID=5083 RepID=A0AAD6IMG7_PENCN|nr:glycosyl hydrolases family 18-domain-containing protein [Penicillium canescens]KAJ6052520.1 glycosyl hydrolases family 18-domain-containing protein [Penicillium canescens]KAJ6063040.1 glycosyl hydrolases family 18-domain-containing protein [Penicillium canescens]